MKVIFLGLSVLLFTNFAAAFSLDKACAIQKMPTNIGSCFVEGTLVNTPDGQVPIEKLELGQKIYSYDVTTQKVIIGTVTSKLAHLKKKVCQLRLSDGNTIKVTPEHKFFIKNVGYYRWQQSRDWYPIGEPLSYKEGVFAYSLDKGGNSPDEASLVIRKTSLESYTTPSLENVYNIEVEPVHNYFANGILVHNIK